MTLNDCCPLVRQHYAEIGSGDQGYVAKAIACAVRALNDVAKDETLTKEQRRNAAMAAANLLISDHKD